MDTSPASAIIDALGGPTAIARQYDITPQYVSKWRRKGIPRPWLLLLRTQHAEVFAVLERPPPAGH